jgi:hypothetical protein
LKNTSCKSVYTYLCIHSCSLSVDFYSPSEKILVLFVPAIRLSLSSLASKTFPHFHLLSPATEPFVGTCTWIGSRPWVQVSCPTKPYRYRPFRHHLRVGEVSPEVSLWGLQEPRFCSGEGMKEDTLCHI